MANCANCEVREKCTKGKERTLSVDSGDKYRKVMREKLSSDEEERFIKRDNES